MREIPTNRQCEVGLKIPVSAVRFRLWARLYPQKRPLSDSTGSTKYTGYGASGASRWPARALVSFVLAFAVLSSGCSGATSGGECTPHTGTYLLTATERPGGTCGAVDAIHAHYSASVGESFAPWLVDGDLCELENDGETYRMDQEWEHGAGVAHLKTARCESVYDVVVTREP